MTRIALFSLILTCTRVTSAAPAAEAAPVVHVDGSGVAQTANATPAPTATPKEASDAAPTGKGTDAKGQKSTAGATKTKTPAPGDAKADDAKDEASAEELEALKALGYVE